MYKRNNQIRVANLFQYSNKTVLLISSICSIAHDGPIQLEKLKYEAGVILYFSY